MKRFYLVPLVVTVALVSLIVELRIAFKIFAFVPLHIIPFVETSRQTKLK